MPVFNYEPKFLYPKSRQFPFDEVCEKIVNSIEKRNWEVPGLNIEFEIYGSGEEKYSYIKKIYGEDFKLYFCRKQGSLKGYNDIAAVSEVTIPFQQIQVNEDESGSTYYLYVGKDWNKDKKSFINEGKCNSKLNNESKTYLKYKGVVLNQGQSLLINDNDSRREYSPEGDEPTEFMLEDKFKEFVDWLEKNVLKYILKFPEVEEIKSPNILEELIPYNGIWTTIFSISNKEFIKKVEIGKKDLEKLEPNDRHASFGSYPRLVPLSFLKDKNIPKVAFDGFIWCDTNQYITQNSNCKSLNSDVVNCYSRCWEKNLIVAICPKYANGIYVFDNQAFYEKRKQIFESIVPRERLNDEELGIAYAVRANSIIPINEYKGGYTEPLVLINRELDFDEIKWVQTEEIK